MAIIKNKYKDRVDSKIKDFPNGTVPLDFTRKIIYDTEALTNPTIIRTPRYGDDLDTTEFAKVIADLIYNDTVINEESEKHNYIYSDGVVRNYKKEFEIYDKNLLQVLSIYEINNILDKSEFTLKTGNSIKGNFTDNNYCKLYFYTNSKRLMNKYNFFYKEFVVNGIKTQDNNTGFNYKDDYSIIAIKGEIDITNADILEGEHLGVVLYLSLTDVNTTSYKTKNFIDYIKVGNGSLKIGDTFVDIKKDTIVSRAIKNNADLNEIKINDIIETKFKDTFRTRRDILIGYYNQTTIQNNMVFEGLVDLVVGEERIGTYAPLDTQLLSTPRIKKIEYLVVNNESFHRIYLDDLCLLKGINHNGDEILFRKVNQIFTIRNSIDNVFDGEYLIKAIDYEKRTIDFVHPNFDGKYFQPEENENIIGYYGFLIPNIYILYSVLVYKDDGYTSETQIMQSDPVFEYIGLESSLTRIEKTTLEINSSGMFEVSNSGLRHLKNFNSNLLEYDDGQSIDVPSKFATGFMLNEKTNGDYILRPTEQQVPNEYDDIGLNSLANSHFVITEDNFSIINNSKISLSEVYLGIKNSLSSIGTEGMKIKIEELTMLYAIDDLRRIESIEISDDGTEILFTLLTFDSNIEIGDILFINNNIYNYDNKSHYGNGDYQTVTVKRIENEKIVINKIPSTFTANFKYNANYPIYFNIIKRQSIKKVCESLLTNDEIKNQIINGLNGKFGDKNAYSKLKFDRFIETVNPTDDLLKNGISVSQAKDFKLEINKYYYLSCAGFVINNIVTSYSSILIEDHNLSDENHFKKSIYYEINIKNFKGRYPNSLIVSDDFGDINVFNINRTFAPFFRMPKYAILAHDFSNLTVSLNDIPTKENVVLFDPLSGRFKFHPNATPSKIYLSYYNTEELSGAAEAENFIYKREDSSNDTIKGKIQDLDNKYVYGADFRSPIQVNGIMVNENLNYKGPFKIKNNHIYLKTDNNFVDLDVNKYEIEINKNSNHEIIDIEKKSLYLKTNIVERNNEVQSINRQFLDQLYDQQEKGYYEKPTLNNNEDLVFNISEDTTVNQSLINSKSWQSKFKQENNVTLPFLANKKFNKINFHNFDKNLIIDCNERTKTENFIINKTGLNELLQEFVYRKLNEKNYKYALNTDYNEDTTFNFKASDELKQLNKTFMKDNIYFNKSEVVNAFTESENNLLMKRNSFDYKNLNINNNNSDNFIIINEHIVNFDIKKINTKYQSITLFSTESISYNDVVENSANILEGTLYFFNSSGYNSVLGKNIETGDFVIKNEKKTDSILDWDFYKKNSFFNISKIVKGDDLSYALNDFNDIGIDYVIDNFTNSLQNKLVNNYLIRNNFLKINEDMFMISVMMRDANDVYNLYIQVFEKNENNFYYPKKIDGQYTYKKIATSQLSSDLLKINKNNIYYDFLTINDETIVLCMMSDSFLFKYFYINDLTIDEGVTFINDKNIKNNPKLFKLNEEIFAILFNSENSLNYDSSIGDLEIKIYNSKTKGNIIFSYKEKTSEYSDVDKIVLDNIKNSSYFNYLQFIDDKIIIFYSNINTFYLNELSVKDNNEYSINSPIGLLNCFKVISFIKTETSYILETSNKKTVFYQNMGQTAFPPKIYPFKINDNIFGVNYIQYNLNDTEVGNRLYTFDINGVLQKEMFINDEYTEQNPSNIKYIYSLNNRQAIEFSSDKISTHSFPNDYSQLILKDSFDYGKYFLKVDNQNYYQNIFKDRLKNSLEIKTIKDKDGNVFDKKIMYFFTKEDTTVNINLTLVNGIDIDFANMTTEGINLSGTMLVEQDEMIIQQSDVLHINNKIFLVFTFLINSESDLNKNKISFFVVDISNKLLNNTFPFLFYKNIEYINQVKKNNIDNKNKFFFNKISDSQLELYCLRDTLYQGVEKNVISKFTFEITSDECAYRFLETRVDQANPTNKVNFNFLNKEVDLFFNREEYNITNIFKVNLNNKIKYVLESEITSIYNYIYVESNYEIFKFFNLSLPFYIKNVYYDETNKDIILFGNNNGNIVNYVFNFNKNSFDNLIIDAFINNKYDLFMIEDTDKKCFFYHRILNNTLSVKIFVKKINQNFITAYETSYNYDSEIENVIFNNYSNIYDTIVYLPNKLVRDVWQIFPMNNVAKSKNLLNYEIVSNRYDSSGSKDLFSNNSISAILSYDAERNMNKMLVFDQELLKKLNNDSIENLIFYINNNGNIFIFKIQESINDNDVYEVVYMVGENTKSNLFNKRLDFLVYQKDDYSFYKKSYQSLALKIEMFNYKGDKKNRYEIYRKNNYLYSEAIYEHNDLYKSNVFLIKGNYKDFQIIYKIDDENEKTKIYTKKFLIINNSLYSFGLRNTILQDKHDDNDKLNFICEKINGSNIFISFKKNNDYIYSYVLNENYGLEQLDPDYTKKELYKFVNVKDENGNNVLQNIQQYSIEPFAVKKIFNGYLLLLLKVKKNNLTKIVHILYKENGATVDYYNNNYNNCFILPESEDNIGYSFPKVNSFGYTNLFIYKKDYSKDILQFGIDGEGGICKLRGINNFL